MSTQDELELEHEAYLVSSAMRKYGGSFVSALGEALSHADHFNIMRIRSAWPELWKEYLKIAKKRGKR